MEEKDLAEMTSTKLRDEALKIPGLTGVHAMKKAELIAAIRQEKGWVEEKVKDLGVKELKLGIAKLRAEREAVRESGNRKKLRPFRIRIKKLKRRTRRLARAKA